MSSLSPLEQRDFERLLEMDSGYVLSFHDRGFAEFFLDVIGLDIDQPRYSTSGGSKAKRLRAFWRIEGDALVGRLLGALVRYVEADDHRSDTNPALLARCRAAATRLEAGALSLGPLKEAVELLDSAYLDRQISRMEEGIKSDPALAVGTAKELVESVCKTVLKERGRHPPEAMDLAPLAKLAVEELRAQRLLDPTSERGNETVRLVLANLSSVVRGIAELRNQHGTGHGKGAATAAVDPSLAILAVSASAAFCRFVLHVHRSHPPAGSSLNAWSPGGAGGPDQVDSTQGSYSAPVAVQPRVS